MSNPTQRQHAIRAHKTLLLSTEEAIIRVACRSRIAANPWELTPSMLTQTVYK